MGVGDQGRVGSVLVGASVVAVGWVLVGENPAMC